MPEPSTSATVRESRLEKSSPELKFIYVYPEPIGIEAGFFDGGDVGEVARTAEAAGWDAFALTEHPAPGARWAANGGHQTLDPLIGLTYAAAMTRTIKLLTYLVVAAYRNPMVLAKAAASLDLLSGGRLILGLGAGYQKSEFYAVGADYDGRGAQLDEALEVLPKHWAGEPFDYKGRYFDAKYVIALPKPQRQIPMWIGGNAAATLRRVADVGSGWMPLMGSAELFSTTGAPVLSGDVALAEQIAKIGERAGARRSEVAIAVAYNEIGPAVRPDDVNRHSERFAALEAIGVTHLIMSGETATASATNAYLEEFSAAFIR
jgi:probable F420-dependent oxidoreductase